MGSTSQRGCRRRLGTIRTWAPRGDEAGGWAIRPRLSGTAGGCGRTGGRCWGLRRLGEAGGRAESRAPESRLLWPPPPPPSPRLPGDRLASPGVARPPAPPLPVAPLPPPFPAPSRTRRCAASRCRALTGAAEGEAAEPQPTGGSRLPGPSAQAQSAVTAGWGRRTAVATRRRAGRRRRGRRGAARRRRAAPPPQFRRPCPRFSDWQRAGGLSFASLSGVAAPAVAARSGTRSPQPDPEAGCRWWALTSASLTATSRWRGAAASRPSPTSTATGARRKCRPHPGLGWGPGQVQRRPPGDRGPPRSPPPAAGALEPLEPRDVPGTKGGPRWPARPGLGWSGASQGTALRVSPLPPAPWATAFPEKWPLALHAQKMKGGYSNPRRICCYFFISPSVSRGDEVLSLRIWDRLTGFRRG